MAIDRRAIMDQTLEAIKKAMPNELVARYKDMEGALDIEKISTGSIAIDGCLGGGPPKGRLIELVGKSSSGKTTLALVIIAQMQKENPDANIMYIDAENALDPSYAVQLGVNLNDIIFCQPNSGDDGYKIASMFVNSGVGDLLVIDSIPSMLPKAMLDYDPGEQQKIAMGATLDTQGIARIFGPANKTGCTVICINQYREKVQIGMPTQGDGISGNGYLPGGQTLPFYFSQIIKIQRVGKVLDGDEVVGDNVRMWVIKNKVGKPYTTVDFVVSYGRGISKADEIIEYGSDEKYWGENPLIQRTARTYSVIDLKTGEIVEGTRHTSRQSFVNFLNDNPSLMEDLVEKIKNKINTVVNGSSASQEAIAEAEEQGALK